MHLLTAEEMKEIIVEKYYPINSKDAELAKSLQIIPYDNANIAAWNYLPKFSMNLTFQRNFSLSRELLAQDPELVKTQLSATYFSILRKILEVARDHNIASADIKSIPFLPMKVVVDPYLTSPGIIIMHPEDFIAAWKFR
ncbi:MAG TPA: hypothetical protein P5213_02930 [Rectinema sp.]|nr:hypothetical protein [Rectinema sp.]